MPRRSGLGLILAAALTASPALPQSAELVGSHTWSVREKDFGGFSAIEVLEGGTRFVAVSDRGRWTQGVIRRDAQGVITALEGEGMRPLRNVEGIPLVSPWSDSEGLAIAADGTAYVSFEGFARVVQYPALDGPGRPLPQHPAFRRLPHNGALEALAVDAAGRVYTLPEWPMAGATVPLFRHEDGVWDAPWDYPVTEGFLPVGADFGPDGRLYILERAFHGLGGFRARVLAMDLPAGGGMLEPQLLLETPPGSHDNLEGLSVWRDDSGAIRLTMISDDSFVLLLRTVVVEYRLVE